jgi:hypothetical protein
MASAYGTRTRSARKPPASSPAIDPSPYIDSGGTDAQDPVRPRRHSRHRPQLTWNGTITRSPGRTPVTPAPASTTSAMPSCPWA